MDYIYTTTGTVGREVGFDSLVPTPIELQVETDDMSIRIKGACGHQVSETLQTVLNKTKRSQNSGNGEAMFFGLAIAFCAGLVIIFRFAFYELGRKTNDSPVRVGRLS